MAKIKDQSIFDKMLSSNRSALDDLLRRGATPGANAPVRSPGEVSESSGTMKSKGGESASEPRGASRKTPAQSSPSGGTQTRLNAKSGDLTFSFRSG